RCVPSSSSMVASWSRAAPCTMCRASAKSSSQAPSGTTTESTFCPDSPPGAQLSATRAVERRGTYTLSTPSAKLLWLNEAPYCSGAAAHARRSASDGKERSGTRNEQDMTSATQRQEPVHRHLEAIPDAQRPFYALTQPDSSARDTLLCEHAHRVEARAGEMQ